MLQQFLPQNACLKTYKKCPDAMPGEQATRVISPFNQNRSSSPVLVMMRIASDNRLHESAIGYRLIFNGLIIYVVNVVIAFVAQLFITIATVNGNRSNPFAAYVAFDFLIPYLTSDKWLAAKKKGRLFCDLICVFFDG
ncbi:Uncharacterised protein [Cronobacter sakazakii]|nr:Uncharacterised protein [Cronobacter sakazakii]